MKKPRKPKVDQRPPKRFVPGRLDYINYVWGTGFCRDDGWAGVHPTTSRTAARLARRYNEKYENRSMVFELVARPDLLLQE